MMEEDQLIQEVTIYFDEELKENINSLGVEAKAEAVWQMIS